MYQFEAFNISHFNQFWYDFCAIELRFQYVGVRPCYSKLALATYGTAWSHPKKWQNVKPDAASQSDSLYYVFCQFGTTWPPK